MLLPKPSGSRTTLGKTTLPFLPSHVSLNSVGCGKVKCDPKVTWLINSAFSNFQSVLNGTYIKYALKRNTNVSSECSKERNQYEVRISIDLESSNTESLTLNTDESYSLVIKSNMSDINVKITAPTYFGARHGLETVSQLTAYQESHSTLQIVSNAVILNDKPSYPYRGLLLDTSRNYFSVNSIKRLITAMSYNKLNTLHWHITDTHSFPIEIKTVPNMMKYGAYSRYKVYLHSDVKSIITHGIVHGIRVLPEFDEPAHCGEGWQWGEKAGLGNLAVCVSKEPWQKYCSEPPCGQLNPTNNNVYDVLGKIYKEYIELFSPDIFHAGGDEINFNCWNTTKEITDWMKNTYKGIKEENFMDMWGMFLKVRDSSTRKNLSSKNLITI